MAETLYTLKDVKREIPRAYFARGLEYKHAGHVSQLQLEPSGVKITAKVRGSNRGRYDVVVHINTEFHPLRISGVCTCPIAYNCKHVAAVLLELLDTSAETEPSSVAAPTETSSSEPAPVEKATPSLADKGEALSRMTQTISDEAQQKVGGDETHLMPVAHLHLYATTLGNSATYNWLEAKAPEQTPLMRLEFEYGRSPIHWYDDVDEVFYRENGRSRSAPRQPKVEKRFIELIKEFGFILLSERRDIEIPPELKNDFYLNEQHINFIQFTHYLIPQLRQAGWRVTLEESFPFHIIDQVDEWYANLDEDNINHWFDLELGIQFNGEKINLLPLLLEALNDPNLFSLSDNISIDAKQNKIYLLQLPNNRILPIPVERLNKILATLYTLFDRKLTDKGRMRLSAYHASLLNELQAGDDATKLRWFGSDRLRQLASQLESFTNIRHVEVSPGFHATLRPYQQHGVDWLQFLREYEFGGILADDMGLGKTVQALAHIHVEKSLGRLDKPVLVIAPTSLIFNWRMEAQRFTPNLSVLTIHGPDRHALFDNLEKYDIVLTSYPLLARDKDELLQHTFHLIILDEAQTIKNPKAKVTQIAMQLKARHRLCLTGTPIENHLGEIWTIFHFLMPGFLGNNDQFRKFYRNPIEKLGSVQQQQQLVRRVAPFLLRRTKDAVAPELPKKTEIIRTVEIEGEQRDLYESIRLAMHQRVRQEIAQRGLAKSHILILDALLKLRQVCCDPRLLKLAQATATVESAKLQLLRDMLPELIEEGRKILLFSQFVSMLELIEAELVTLNIPFVKLTGQTKDRQTPIESFQNGEVPLFLISLKAGGTGLNLTAADTVIHYDPWWNPAVENQATDRAHRIGQDKPVFVYKLITAGTVEEKMIALQERKHQLAQSVYEGGQKEEGALTADDLNVLFEPIN